MSVFFFSASFLFYALAGYPLLLAILARWHSRPVEKRLERRTVTVILPVYNGEPWIAQKLNSIFALDYPAELLQVVVISDGSVDRTEAIAMQFEGVQVVRIPKGGKALAVNKGMSLAKGEILFFTDVRQSLAPDCLRKLVACFADGQVGGVCGELVIRDGLTQEENSVGLYWKIEKWMRSQLSARGTLLVVTGCLYAIRRELAKPVPSEALGDDIFMPQAILRQGYRVVFESEAKAYDYPTARDVEFHRKVRTLAGLYQFVGKYGLGRHWFHFFSYKVSRLILPYMLALFAFSSFMLPAPYAALLIAAQVLFYSLAAVDRFVPEGSMLKPVCAAAHTFCMLMAASLFAVTVLFVPSKKLWKASQVKAPKFLG